MTSHIHKSKITFHVFVSFFTGNPPPNGSYLNILLPTEDFLSFPTCSPLVNQGIHFFCFCFFHSFYWKATKDSTTQKHVVGRVDTFRNDISNHQIQKRKSCLINMHPPITPPIVKKIWSTFASCY